MDFLKKGLKHIAKKIENNARAREKKAQLQSLMQQHQYASYGQVLLHDALGNILRECTISSKLCKITYVTDLIPSGYNICPDGSTAYYFRWTKFNPDEVISITTCDRIQKKINCAIDTITKRYGMVYQMLDEWMKPQFIQNYPALYNGFRVIKCTDATDDIIVTVVFN